MWGPDDCGPDGFTPDGSPCFPGTNTPPNQTPPPGGGDTGGGGCPAGTEPLPADPRVCRPIGRPDAGPGGDPEEDFGGFDYPAFTGRGRYDVGPAPRFNAPRWSLPSLAEAENEPGYQFAKQEGLGAIEASAAARGMLNTGGVPKQLYSWADKFANQNYGRVVDRSLQGFDRLYRGAYDEYRPLLDEWQAQNMASRDAWMREWDAYLAELEMWRWGNPSADAILGYGAE